MPDVIYLDNAATSWPKPPVVGAAMGRFLDQEAANPGRAGHRMAVAAERMLDRVRKQLTDFIGGTDPTRMIFTLNGTDALNIALKGILRAGDHVITTTLEHNSVSRPLEAMARRGQITLTRVEFSPATGTIDLADLAAAITPRTRLVVMTQASNVLGTIQPVAAVGRIVRERGGGVRFLVDAAQTIGTVPIHVERDRIDLLAFPGHKGLLGPPGTGGLYVAPTIGLNDLLPFREGGTGGDSAHPTMPETFPYYLEGGTPNTVGIAGLEAALSYVQDRTPAAILAHERALLQRLIEGLAGLGQAKVQIYGPGTVENSVGTLSFNLNQGGYTPQEVGGILDESFGIAVRPGLHCAPYTHRTLGTFPDGTLRVSPGPFTTVQEMDQLLQALSGL